jgi:hypothetical protein
MYVRSDHNLAKINNDQCPVMSNDELIPMQSAAHSRVWELNLMKH